jgi:hypothetical protein
LPAQQNTPLSSPQVRNAHKAEVSPPFFQKKGGLPQVYEQLQSFFHFLTQQHDFAYTIFGSKPMSLADINLEMPLNLSLYKQLKARFILYANQAMDKWYILKKSWHRLARHDFSRMFF